MTSGAKTVKFPPVIFPVSVAFGLSFEAQAATVRSDGAMACPSISAWEQVMEGLHSRGGEYAQTQAAIDAGRKGDCVSVPNGTQLDTMGTVGPFSKVPNPGTGKMFYFRSQDLQ